MPFADTSLRDEYAAAVERVAGRTLDALRCAGGAAALTDRSSRPPSPSSPPSPPPPSSSFRAADGGSPGFPGFPPLDGSGPPDGSGRPDGTGSSVGTGTGTRDGGGADDGSRAVLAAVRVIGPDVFAPRLLAAAGPDETTADLVARARQAFPVTAAGRHDTGRPVADRPAADGSGHDRSGGADAGADRAEAAHLVAVWQDWACARLLGHPEPVPDLLPRTSPEDWPAWSVRMARLSALALPGFDSPLHRSARAHSLALSRGAVRSMLRRDHRTAARLTRWLAWLRADGTTLPLEVEPLLDRLCAVGDGSARTGLELAIGIRLSNGAPA